MSAMWVFLGIAAGVLLGVAVAVAVLARAAPVAGRPDPAHQQLLEQLAARQAQQLGASLAAGQQDLTAKKDLIDARLQQVHQELRAELNRLGGLVHHLHQANAERFGQVDVSLQQHVQVARVLADTTRGLREALSSTTARGQWGERMAEDVLRLAGLQEGINYVRQTPVAGASGVPDYTFLLPKGHVLYMDVKFPLSAYLRYLEATSDSDRHAHLQTFLRDVRLRVRELARRDYTTVGTCPTVDYVLLFLPNEQLTGFIFEHDPGLLDHALEQRVVLCSPLTLFAFLGVIRQAFDSFMIEQTSDEILHLLGTFGTQWGKFTDGLDAVKRRVDGLQKDLDNLLGPRRRQLERPLVQLEALRRERGIDSAGELFPATEADEHDDSALHPAPGVPG